MTLKIEQNNVKYPEFGQAIGNPFALNEQQRAHRVAAFSLGNLAMASIGMVWGAPVALGTGGVAVVAVVIYHVAKALFFAYKSHQYRLAFNPAENNPRLKIGRLCKS